MLLLLLHAAAAADVVAIQLQESAHDTLRWYSSPPVEAGARNVRGRIGQIKLRMNDMVASKTFLPADFCKTEDVTCWRREPRYFSGRCFSKKAHVFAGGFSVQLEDDLCSRLQARLRSGARTDQSLLPC